MMDKIELGGSKKHNNNDDSNDSNPIILRSLTDRQKIVIETMVMRLSAKEALEYLNDHGFLIKVATYFREKSKLEKMKMERLYLMAKIGFVDQHLDKIDKLEFIEKEMWKKYRECKDPAKSVNILTQIANLHPILSAFYDSTRYILEKQYPDIGYSVFEKKEFSDTF
jgi:hypothetical protein